MADLFANDGIEIDNVVREAAAGTALLHKTLGLPLVSWKDGDVHLIAPEDIVVPPDARLPITHTVSAGEACALLGASRRR